MSLGETSSTYPRRGLCGQVTHELGQRIVAGDFEAGKALPTESELSSQFNVSRTALREAVKILTAKGLMESRPRTGTRVRPRSDWHLVDPDVIAWHCAVTPSADFLCDLFEIRLIVEPNAAALAAERRTDADIRDIEQELAEMSQALGNGGDMVGPNVRFHMAILEAAANPFSRHPGRADGSRVFAHGPNRLGKRSGVLFGQRPPVGAGCTDRRPGGNGPPVHAIPDVDYPGRSAEGSLAKEHQTAPVPGMI